MRVSFQFIYLCLFFTIHSFSEFKNIDELIKADEAITNRKVTSYEETSIENITAKINLKSNIIIVFHTEWCGHCKRFIPIFDEASKYSMLSSYSFIKVQCSDHKEVCEHFEVRKYPTIKVYIRGVEQSTEPNREKYQLIDFLYKISTSSYIKIESNEELSNFISNYGSLSFLFFDFESKESKNELNQCIEEVTNESSIKPFYYFGYTTNKDLLVKYIPLSKSTNEGIVLVSEGNISSTNVEYFKSCQSIKSFINKNKFPILKKANISYLRRLTESKVMLVLISVKNRDEITFIRNELIFYINRNQHIDLVFSFVEKDDAEDTKLFNHFKLNADKAYQILLYNFSNRKYFLDPSENSNSNELLGALIGLMNNDISTLTFITGNPIDDVLNYLGIESSPMVTVIIIVLGIFIIFIMIFICIYISESGTRKLAEERKKLKQKPKVE